MKKILIGTVILCMLILCACSTVQTTEKVTSQPPLATSTLAPTITKTPLPINVDASKLKGVQVFFMHPWSGDLGTLMDNLVNKFNQTNSWGISVVVEKAGSSGALMDNLASQIQSGLQPQLIAAPIDELLALNRNSKTILDLNPYVYSGQWGMDPQIIQGYLPVFWSQDEVNGYRYGIPAQRSAKVMIYNKTWAAELGFSSPPQTLDQFQSQVCAAHASLKLDKDPNNDGLGGWIIDTDAMTLASWAESFGAPLQSDGQITFSTPEMTSTLGYLRKLLDSGCAWNSADPSPFDYFAKRQTLIYSADLQDLPLQQEALQLAGSQDEWEVIPFPTSSSPFLLTQGPSYAILTSSDVKQLAAWLFIRWLSSPDNMSAITKASTTLPLGEAFVNNSLDLENSLPQWKQAVDLLPEAQITPQSAQWSDAKVVFEDAAWQLFKTDYKVDQIPSLTAEMDSTLKDLTGASQ